MEQGWVVLVYKATREPSRHRVALWRRLKAAGALYLQDSVCALPDSDEHRALFTALATEIRDTGGEALVLVAAGLDETADRSIIERFNAERDHDYDEIVEQCAELLGEIERETARRRFTFAALEDTESNLERLRRWVDKITHRDFFQAAGAGQAHAALGRCSAACATFAAAVWHHSEIEPD